MHKITASTTFAVNVYKLQKFVLDIIQANWMLPKFYRSHIKLTIYNHNIQPLIKGKIILEFRASVKYYNKYSTALQRI